MNRYLPDVRAVIVCLLLLTGGIVLAPSALSLSALLGQETLAASGEADAAGGDANAGSQEAEALPDPLVLGFLPAQRAEEMAPDAERLAEFLEARLEVDVDVTIPTSYEPLIEGFRFGHIHAAFMDGGPAWIAHQRAEAEAVLAEVNDGRSFYWAEAFVRTDSPIESIEEVPGQRVAFTSRTGSSGFYMPIGSMISEDLLQPEGDDLTALEEMLRDSFEATVYAGGYRAALQALLDGRVEVAFGAHDAPERFLTEEQRGEIRTLHRFGRIPSHAVMVSGEIGAADTERIREALLELNDGGASAEGPGILRDLYGVDGLEAVDTESHLGEFGRAFASLPGVERTLRAEAN